jgi:hypothetical protein
MQAVLTVLTTIGWTALATWGAVLLGTGVLHLLPRLGGAGKRVSHSLRSGLPLDLVVGYLVALPPLVATIWAGWAGLAGAVIGQVLGLITWTLLHELRHRRTHGRAQIITALNRIAGPGNNLIGLYWTLWAAPCFILIRLAQYFVWPVLTWTIKLPRYDASRWVSVSRHKFEGLVGHDRIWCLYCDWMTGVWSLGGEMLRNVESFYCPIRFGDAEKCANCSVDFPDINNGWAPYDSDMATVRQTLEREYGPEGEVVPRAWFGHPDRTPTQLTVNGQDVAREETSAARS